MTHATADLEYFMCDMCHKYLHRDIFCDHRRECKGPTSTELKKKEVRAIEENIDAADRERLARQQDDPRGAIEARIPLDAKQKLQNCTLRRTVADEYQKEQDEKLKEKLAGGRLADLLAQLDE